MIKILIFDLWDTLVQGENEFPHAREALNVLSKFENEAGDKLNMYLVSNQDGTTSLASERKLPSVFQDFTKLLKALNLKIFFKEHEQPFDKSVSQSDITAEFDECLFISGDTKQLSICRKWGMKVLRFTPSESGDADFGDWSEAPLLIARLAVPDSSYNRKVALQFYLATNFGLDLVSINYAISPDLIEGRVKKSFPVTIKTRDGALETIQTLVPVNVMVKLNKNGKVSSVKSDEPNAEELAESAHFITSLEDNAQISHKHGKLKHNETHVLVADEKGQKRLKRKRYTAI